MSNLPGVVRPSAESVAEAVSKLQWPLVAANSITEALSQQGFRYTIKSTTTATGRVLLVVG